MNILSTSKLLLKFGSRETVTPLRWLYLFINVLRSNFHYDSIQMSCVHRFKIPSFLSTNNDLHKKDIALVNYEFCAWIFSIVYDISACLAFSVF